MEQMTVSQYAKIAKCAPQNVYNILYTKKLPAGVIRADKLGTTTILTVDPEATKAHAKKRLKKSGK